jgi:glycosyltransferase involved in cell wall biosynthesis
VPAPLPAPRRLGVCFGKLTSLHEGLGEYAWLFGEHLAARAEELAAADRVQLHFRLPRRYHGAFGPRVQHSEAAGWERWTRSPSGAFALWHSLHQHNPFRPPWGAAQVLCTVHDLNHLHGNDERFRRKASRRLARVVAESDALVAISEHTQRELLAATAGHRPIHTILNGVRDLAVQPQQRPAALPAAIGEGRYFFHLSRMAALKNPQALLALMALRPHDTLVMAGPRAGESEAVAAEVARRGLANVLLLFDVSTAEKAWLLAHCRAFLFPSLAEGFGLPPIEAMQFGRPVLLAHRTSLPEIGGPVAGYWHSFEPAAMSVALDARLAEAAADAAADAARVRAWAARFSWPRCIDEHLALYRRLLSGAAA